MKQKLKIIFLSTAFLSIGLLSSNLKAIDLDNNPPGPAGGPGTNWENPPGLKGGVGASPNRHHRYRHRHHHYCKNHDCDNNPPGPAGGPGTNWENPPGPAGGPGASPNIK